jgi:hypothetical protein
VGDSPAAVLNSNEVREEFDHLLDAETMREHDRFGAIAAGVEQFERATAIGLRDCEGGCGG